jgi:hypothetical protein
VVLCEDARSNLAAFLDAVSLSFDLLFGETAIFAVVVELLYCTTA